MITLASSFTSAISNSWTIVTNFLDAFGLQRCRQRGMLLLQVIIIRTSRIGNARSRKWPLTKALKFRGGECRSMNTSSTRWLPVFNRLKTCLSTSVTGLLKHGGFSDNVWYATNQSVGDVLFRTAWRVAVAFFVPFYVCFRSQALPLSGTPASRDGDDDYYMLVALVIGSMVVKKRTIVIVIEIIWWHLQ